jgi:hypothetical protein
MLRFYAYMLWIQCCSPVQTHMQHNPYQMEYQCSVLCRVFGTPDDLSNRMSFSPRVGLAPGGILWLWMFTSTYRGLLISTGDLISHLVLMELCRASKDCTKCVFQRWSQACFCPQLHDIMGDSPNWCMGAMCSNMQYHKVLLISTHMCRGSN